jgi:hypothetical protein
MKTKKKLANQVAQKKRVSRLLRKSSAEISNMERGE